MGTDQDEKSWWERNVEDTVSESYDRERAAIPEYDVLGRQMHDAEVGAMKGAYHFGKGLVIGLVDVAVVTGKLMSGDPETYQKAWEITKKVAKEAYISQFGSPQEQMDQNRRTNDAIYAVGHSVYESMKKDWEEAGKIGKHTELVSKWATEGVLTVASFFIGGGEIEAAANTARTGELAGTVSTVEKCSIEARALGKTAGAVEDAAKAARAGEDAAKVAGEVPKKKLGLGLKNKNTDYVKWAKERGYNTYGELSGSGNFSEQIEQAMNAADEIHFNLKDVDPSRANGALNEYGEPASGYTNYELYMVKTKFRDKVIWHQPDGTVADKGWMPPGF
jgi:hypothetical protein